MTITTSCVYEAQTRSDAGHGRGGSDGSKSPACRLRAWLVTSSRLLRDASSSGVPVSLTISPELITIFSSARAVREYQYENDERE